MLVPWCGRSVWGGWVRGQRGAGKKKKFTTQKCPTECDYGRMQCTGREKERVVSSSRLPSTGRPQEPQLRHFLQLWTSREKLWAETQRWREEAGQLTNRMWSRFRLINVQKRMKKVCLWAEQRGSLRRTNQTESSRGSCHYYYYYFHVTEQAANSRSVQSIRWCRGGGWRGGWG